jgi:hypothetical protein
LDNSSRAHRLEGGVRRIPITTPRGTFKVWTKRVGNNPRIKLLLLHGGPGCTHEYFEACDSYLPAAGSELEASGKLMKWDRTGCRRDNPDSARAADSRHRFHVRRIHRVMTRTDSHVGIPIRRRSASAPATAFYEISERAGGAWLRLITIGAVVIASGSRTH